MHSKEENLPVLIGRWLMELYFIIAIPPPQIEIDLPLYFARSNLGGSKENNKEL